MVAMAFFFQLYGDHRDLHSFPTRRSSDLISSHALNPFIPDEIPFWPKLRQGGRNFPAVAVADWDYTARSEEHTSELQSRPHLVCRLLLEKKNGPDWQIAARACFARI